MNEGYIEECPKPIPIGKQKFAYQCEDIVIEPLFGSANIRAYPPGNRGKEPYPNPEANLIQHYEIKIERFTGNSISLTLTKKFKDGATEVYHTNTSFSLLANSLFEGSPVNFFKEDPPMSNFKL